MTIIVVGLAAWRLAVMLVREDGPWGVFERFRHALGVPPAGTPYAEDEVPMPGRILLCTWCASVWTALALWLCLQWLARWPVVVLAGAGVAATLEAVHGRLER